MQHVGSVQALVRDSVAAAAVVPRHQRHAKRQVPRRVRAAWLRRGQEVGWA